MYFETMKCMFHQIPVKLPKALSCGGKIQSLLHSIGGNWYMRKFNEKLPSLKKRKAEQKSTTK